jgi:TPR repeat protein
MTLKINPWLLKLSLASLFLGFSLAKAAELTEEKIAKIHTAANQGDARAQNNLGACFQYGWGGVQSDTEALKWYEKSANQGFVAAQQNLGCFYMMPRRNKVEAYKWYLLAAARGSSNAKQNIWSLERTLSPKQLAEGQKAAADWQAEFEKKTSQK